MKRVGACIFLLWVLPCAAVWGQFTPGHVFVSDPHIKFCGNQQLLGGDKIWEIDPDSGEVTLFAELLGEDCGFVTGLVFTPNGCGLRASSALNHRILEFAPDGPWHVALGFEDGIRIPSGSNNLAYDAKGDFYVVNGSRTIMRFPVDGGPGVVFADDEDGISGGGAIAFAADGDLYYGNTNSADNTLRISPAGNATLFEDYGFDDPVAVTADLAGQVYVGLETSQLLRYNMGEPESTELLTSGLLGLRHAIAMAPDQAHVYVATAAQELIAVDVDDGTRDSLAVVVSSRLVGAGIAVVPFPPGDWTLDAAVELDDAAGWAQCLTGPGKPPTLNGCGRLDVERDGDVDLGDFSRFQTRVGQVGLKCS
jgi:hypothetical protein